MKNILNKLSSAAGFRKIERQHNSYYSVSMDFEDSLLKSSKEMDSFSESWVDTELERSKIYFYEKIENC